MKCFKILNFDPAELISNFNVIPKPSNGAGLGVAGLDPKNYLKEYYYNKLSDLGNLSSLVFYMKPNTTKGNIHIDIDKSSVPLTASLNIIIKGQGVMKWFQPTTDAPIKFNSAAGVFYKSWENLQEYGKIVDEWKEGKIALVRPDMPHNVWNPGKEDRLIVSIRWDKKMSWEETLLWFEQNLKKE